MSLNINVIKDKILSENWFVLRNMTYELTRSDGSEVGEVRKLFELFMSPGGVTELIYFFIAEYDDTQRANDGGGVDDEDIEVLELPYHRALEMMANGEIRDGKAVILLQYLQTSGLMNGDL